MYSKTPHSKWCALLTLLAIAGASLISNSALAGGKREKIEFSEPSTKSPVVTSNLDRINISPSNIKPVPENFFKQFESLNSAGPTPIIPFRQSQPPPLSKHAKELLDQRRNWAFTDLKDLSPGQNLEESFGIKEYGPDGNEKKAQSAIDKYYESLGQKQNSTQNSSLANGLDSTRNSGSLSTNGLPRSEFSREASPSLRNAFILESGNPFTRPNGNSSATFATSPFVQAPPDKVQLQQQQQHRLEFQKLLANPYSTPAATPSPVNLQQPGLVSQSAINNNATSPFATQAESRSKLNPYLGVATAPTLRSQVLLDPTARALGLPDPSLLPKPEVAPKAPPASAFAKPLPMRKF
ncbi:MAG: hypothetical protein JWQ71_1985 [Pedosphaera sp.]|nr:hypothetical protein [Pedosphaera sp.]